MFPDIPPAAPYNPSARRKTRRRRRPWVLPAAAVLAVVLVGNDADAVDRFCPVETTDPEASDDCPDCIRKALMITDPAIIGENGAEPTRPEWSFRYLIEQMAGAHDPALFVADWLLSFEHDQVVNGFTIPARASIRDLVIAPWKKRLGLDPGEDTDAAWVAEDRFFDEHPFQLAAIINRIDLAKFERSPLGEFTDVRNAGEGRFVFQILGADEESGALEPENPLAFTIIFEYALRAESPEQLLTWAERWRGLADLDGEAYENELVQITRAFTDRDSAIMRPNSVALNQLRTNEIALGLVLSPRQPWELREFRLDPDGELRNVTVAMTPDLQTFDETEAGRETLVRFMTEQVGPETQSHPRVDALPADEILDGQVINGLEFGVPPEFEQANFRASRALVPNNWPEATFPDNERPTAQKTWLLDPAPTTQVDADDRLWFSFNTCNGCHSGDTGTVFTQIDLRGAGRLPGSVPGFPEVPDSVLSRFLCEFDLKARKRGLLLMLDAREEEESFLASLINEAQQRVDVAQMKRQAVPTPAEPVPGYLSCPLAPEGSEAYDRTWMGCFMLERQTRVH